MGHHRWPNAGRFGIGSPGGIGALAMAEDLCRVPAFAYCEVLLRQQENPESESVRNQEQRHYQSRKEECGSQLPSQQPGVIGLVESVEEIGRTPDAEEPCDGNARRTGQQ